MFNNNPMMGGYSPQNSNYNYPGMGMSPFKTNKLFVTSIDDAMARFAEPNSEMVYLHQDMPLLIQIKTDMQGRKIPMVFDLVEHVEKSAPTGDFVTRSDVEEIVKKQFEAWNNKEIE